MELNNFLSGEQNGKIPQDAVQALDIVVRQMPSMYYTPVGRSFFPFDGQGRPLGEGCEVKFGFYSSIRHSEWKAMLVNIDGELLQLVKFHINYCSHHCFEKKFEEYMKCCLLSNVQVSKNLFSKVYCNSWNEPLFPFEIELHSVPDHEPINPLHPIISMCLLHTILYTIISWGVDKENLVNNQELF